MFSHNEKYYGKIQELNNLYRFRAKEDSTNGRIKLKDLKTKFNIPNIKQKLTLVNVSDKRSNVSRLNQNRGTTTPAELLSPLHKKESVRISTTKRVPRKAETMNKYTYFGSKK